MSGFPERILRSSLGPKLRDIVPVENPETDIPASAFESVFWQVAGSNLIQPRVVCIAEWTGSAFNIFHQGEAWNANAEQAHPVLAREGAGDYTYTFASNYLNELSEAINTVLIAARVNPVRLIDDASDALRGGAWVEPTDPLKIRFRLYDSVSVLRDARFWLEVF